MADGKFSGKVLPSEARGVIAVRSLVALILSLAVGLSVSLACGEVRAGGVTVEKLLLQGLELIAQGRTREAETVVHDVLVQQPDFRLANVVLGDLYLMKTGKLTQFASGVAGYDKELADFLAEAKVRLENTKSSPQDAMPGELLRISANHRYALVVDLSRSRLHLFQNKQSIPEKVADFYITIGKEGGGKEQQGDKKTPIGLYRITGRLESGSLPGFYGAGALPLDYPNSWDQLHHRTGSGIWLHGTPVETYSRPPRASDGCVVLTNPDFKVLSQWLAVDDPVVLTQHIDWIPADEWRRRRELISQRIDQWRSDWTRLKGTGVLRYYSTQYRSGHLDDALWNQLQDGNVALKDPGILSYPGVEKMVVVTWEGVPQTDTGNRGVPMTQYWRLEENSDWKIIFEPNG
ncbi:MAG: L,D-transpeptidase family protein [Magnetococcales bacterium]|nr:L,D-transpeptidase family protein [Magnetococcales bacterium]